MTIDKEASYYDLDIHNVGIVETDQLVRCILERAGLTAHSSHRLGVLIERIARLGAKPGTDVQREVSKIAIEAGMLRDSVLWDQPLSEVLAELREIHSKSEWAQMDDPVGELMRMRYGDDKAPEDADAPGTLVETDAIDSVSPDPAARIAELERERDEARLAHAENAKVASSWLNTWKNEYAHRERAQADLAALRTTLETERQAAVTTAEELERVRKELADLRKTYDVEMEFRAEMRDELGAHVVEGFDAFLRRVCRELADLRDRYRPRRQSEEPAPKGAVMIWAPRDHYGPAGWCYATHEDIQRDDIWTHQPPGPGEGE